MMMQIIKNVREWKTIRKSLESSHQTIGFVPTMGNLHAGHQSLLEKSIKKNDITVLTIFVNPTQFNNRDDLQNYPRSFTQDSEMAEKIGVNYLLTPDETALYPVQYTYKISENTISQKLEGEHRPGHFDGMLTIVMKLLMLIKPHRAYFGEKDFQQLELVKGLVQAFFLDVEIVGCPTVRTESGLALSSRNTLLTTDQLTQAEKFPELLFSKKPVNHVKKQLQTLGFEVDYIDEYQGRRIGAVRLNGIRLIDNGEVK